MMSSVARPRRLGRLMVPGAAVLSSFAGIGLNLALPFLLTTTEYARYSLLLGIAQLVSSIAFEWVRVGILRYGYDEAGSAEARTRRTMLIVTYAVLFVAMIVLAAASFALSAGIAWASAAAMVLLLAAVQGVFDGQQAANRANFDNVMFSLRLIARPVVALVASAILAMIYRSAEAALIGMVIAYVLVGVAGIRPRLDIDRPVRFDWPGYWRLARFGLFSAIGTNLAMGLLALFRATVIAAVGSAAAAGILLAFDLGQRVFGTVGTIINVVLLQNSIRAADSRDETRIAQQMRYQVTAVSIVVVPCIIGFYFLQAVVAAVAVPGVYHASFLTGSAAAIFATGLMTIRQFSLDPAYVIFGTSAGAPLGPSASILTLLACMTLPVGMWPSPTLAAVLPLILAAVIGTLASLAGLLRLTRFRWPLRDIAGVAAAAVLMIVIGAVLPPPAGIVGAGVNGVAMLGVFVAGLVGLDVLGGRGAIGGLVGRNRTK